MFSGKQCTDIKEFKKMSMDAQLQATKELGKSSMSGEDAHPSHGFSQRCDFQSFSFPSSLEFDVPQGPDR